MKVTERTTLLLSIVALVVSTATLLIVVGILPRPHDDAEEPTDHKALAGTMWLLQSLGPTGNLHPALTTTEVTLQFSDDGRVNGQAGCNSYFGQYSSDVDGSLTITGLGSTKMFCHEPGVMQQEQDFLNALAAAERYEVKNGRLHISGGGTEMVLSYV
jgi:heat shock protein HslJ